MISFCCGVPSSVDVTVVTPKLVRAVFQTSISAKASLSVRMVNSKPPNPKMVISASVTTGAVVVSVSPALLESVREIRTASSLSI